MRRRYHFQEGGLAAADDDDASDAIADPEIDETDATDQPGGAVTTSGGLSALDIPGAAEAFGLMQKSAEQARKALQEARTSIMGRQYSRADALLAASAALGAPTRSGSTAESFANMAGALRGPLAARQSFDIQKQKDLLGVNTQLAGLDEREAQARFALAQLQAKLRAQSLNAPLEKVVVPGQTNPIYKTRAAARDQPAYVPPSASTNISLNTDKTLYGKMGDLLGQEYVDQYKAAQNAQNLMDRNQQVRELLKTNPYTGSLADWKLALGKGLKAFGVNMSGDDIKNTELLFSNLGNNVLESIHASGLGSGNGFTDKDLEFLRQVKGGSIKLDPDTLASLADLSDRTARLSTQRWNSTFGRLKPDLMKELGLQPIALREPGGAPQGAAAPAEPAAAGAPPAAGAAPPAAAAPAAPAAQAAPYGIAPAQWAVDPANPPPRAAPAREAYLKTHPETRQQFLDHYGYLPN